MRSLIFFLLLFGSAISAFSQSLKVDSLKAIYDRYYGLNMLLHNGKKYFIETNPKEGHPFWRFNEDVQGDLFIRGESFKNHWMRYDILSQKIVLSYSDYSGYHSPIVLTNSLIDSIHIVDATFLRRPLSAIRQPFVQLVYSGNKMVCYIGLYKTSVSRIDKNQLVTNISEEQRDYYIVSEGKLHRFNRKSSFLEIFEKRQKRQIKKYISENRLRFKEIKIQQLKKLILYSESTMN